MFGTNEFTSMIERKSITGESATYNTDGLTYNISWLSGPHVNQHYINALKSLGEVNLNETDFKSVYREMLGGNSHVFVAITSDKVIGVITLLVERKMIHSGGLVGHIEDVAVNNEFKGRGVGSSLVDYAVNQARSVGCYKVILNCDSQIAKFYEKLGFHQHGVEMRKDLN